MIEVLYGEVQRIYDKEAVICDFRVPVKVWAEDIEQSAMGQISNLANLPFAFHHIAIMPDCHSGYGMPIGGVLATEGVVLPNAVGVDIGCGMCAVKTSLKADQLDKDTLKQVMGKIREAVPVGFNHHKEKQDKSLMPNFPEYYKIYARSEGYPIVYREYESALRQIGTLGGGNHFIEIQKDQDGNVWIMIHSGSRNLGKKVADHYNKLAVELNENWCSSVPKKWELAFLPLDSEEGRSYLREMNYCVDFALANRKLMMERILETFRKSFDNQLFAIHSQKECDIDSWLINIAHNYASMENHFGKNVMVHRKGATLARTGMIGIIPGSQGSRSYIVRGKGNPDSFMSCSHGAGRAMSRTKAIATLSLDDEVRKMNEQGIIHGIRGKKDLDEASSAYKDIDRVMYNQRDLVEVVETLTPLGVIKG